jgi:hypothetical protein
LKLGEAGRESGAMLELEGESSVEESGANDARPGEFDGVRTMFVDV